MSASYDKGEQNVGYDLQVISHQPEASNAELLNASPPFENIEVPEVENIISVGISYHLCMCCFYLWYILLCPLSIIATMIYPCVSLKGRRKFMNCIQCLYMNCCCAFDCVTPLSLYDAMSRYEENPLPDKKAYVTGSVVPTDLSLRIIEAAQQGRFMHCFQCLHMKCCCAFDYVTPLSLYDAMSRYEENSLPDKQGLIQSIIRNRFIISVLETLNESFPDYFFSFLPSGSLREGFARVLPSSSILASDYDIMLIPDAICVGEEGKSYAQEQTPAFRICSSPTDHPDGYVWLKLDDNYLIQWERVCLRRHYKNEGASFLSSQMVLKDVRHSIENSSDLKQQIIVYLNRHVKEDDMSVTVVRSGPALTVKARVIEKKILCLCSNGMSERIIFHADFTLALHCCFWPTETLGFFDGSKRTNWPEENVIATIKRLGCHVVPKQSIDQLVKLCAEQAEHTTYGRSPGLEWRYSFSQAEMILTDNIPPPARTAFLAVKAINKRHLNLKGRDMCSYPLKCILFSIVEKKPKSYWNQECIIIAEAILREMLEELKNCFENVKCWHYWIPTINVLGLTSSDCARKLLLLNQIIADPKRYVGDQWLEYTRCIRLNCIYCGPTGYITRFMQSNEVGDTSVEKPCYCCSCNFRYGPNTTACGPCAGFRAFDAY